MKPYKNLGKRVQNLGTGQLGTIVAATRKPDSKVWNLEIQFDMEKTRGATGWDSSSCWRFNRIVADDYAPDYGPIPDRLRAILARLEQEIPSRLRHITEVHVGHDSITYWKPTFQHEFTVSLWAGQGSWRCKHSDREIALNMLRETLGGILSAEPLAALTPFRFEIGKTYETQAGNLVTVLGRTDERGCECLECSDGKYRYDRSTGGSDAGRVTGTAHDYSCPDNLKRS